MNSLIKLVYKSIKFKKILYLYYFYLIIYILISSFIIYIYFNIKIILFIFNNYYKLNYIYKFNLYKHYNN